MPVTRAFLRPVTVEPPPQGDFEYIPEVYGYEGDTMAELIDAMNGGVGTQSTDLENYFVVEDIQYQVAVTKPAVGNNSAELLYSAMVWATRVHKV